MVQLSYVEGKTRMARSQMLHALLVSTLESFLMSSLPTRRQLLSVFNTFNVSNSRFG